MGFARYLQWWMSPWEQLHFHQRRGSLLQGMQLQQPLLTSRNAIFLLHASWV